MLFRSRAPPYYPDADLAHDILRVLDEEGPRTFIFAITMGNHGPWLAKSPPLDPVVAGIVDPAEVPGGGELLRDISRSCAAQGQQQPTFSAKALDQRGGNYASFLGYIGEREFGRAAALHDARRGGENGFVGSFAGARAH